MEDSAKKKINDYDSLGNTLLHLAVKMAYRHLTYREIIKLLLKNGANPKIKDADGWTCIDEAVAQEDEVVLRLLLDNLIARQVQTIKDQQEKLKSALTNAPDFYIEMKWDFDSSFIPFVSKFAPSDTFKIWKYKDCLRVDSTLANFKKFKAKRRDMSLIFNPKFPNNPIYKSSAPLMALYR
jgi:hypothetical protein